MSPVHAKLLTIVTVFEARDRVVRKLEDLGVRGFSVSRVEGFGVHGQKRTGLVEVENVAFAVVASEPLVAKALEWVEKELFSHHPGIAYAADIVAVAPSSFA